MVITDTEVESSGTARGDLARHVTMSKKFKGQPVFTRRVEVFQQVSDQKHRSMKIARLIVSQVFFATLLTQVLAFGFTKLSVLLFYKRSIARPRTLACTHPVLEYSKEPNSELPYGQ